MLDNDALDVVGFFENKLKDKNLKVIDDYFKSEVLAKVKVDVAANKTTADEIRSLDAKIHKTSRSAKATKGLMIFIIILSCLLFAAGVLFIVLGAMNKLIPPSGAWIGGGVAGVILGCVIFGLSFLLKKNYKTKEALVQDLTIKRQEEFNVAMKQLADFHARFHADMAFDIFAKTYPTINFDDYFTKDSYLNWTMWLQDDVNSSALYCLSGDVNTNPFIVLRTKNTKMYPHVYTGSVTRMVPTRVYVNGHWQTQMQAVVITATTTNPAPMYWNETKLYFKSNAAPDLVFHNLEAFKSEKKAEKYFRKSDNTQPMDNPEFDKVFPCERNNETQFRLLFSPFAQENMVKLMATKSDYNFNKNKTINVINSPTFNNINMNYNFARYWYMYDYEEIKSDFYSFNHNFFTNIYYMFAPLLVVPLYQQYRFKETLADKKVKKMLEMSFMESESSANTLFDPNYFKSSLSKTEDIIKAKKIFANDLYQINEIISRGYNTKTRVVVVTVFHPKAGATPVPITVIDYLPVSQSSYITSSMITNLDDDFNINENENKSFSEKYLKPFGATSAIKSGSLIHMLMKARTNAEVKIEPDRYKNFLADLTKTKME